MYITECLIIRRHELNLCIFPHDFKVPLASFFLVCVSFLRSFQTRIVRHSVGRAQCNPLWSLLDRGWRKYLHLQCPNCIWITWGLNLDIGTSVQYLLDAMHLHLSVLQDAEVCHTVTELSMDMKGLISQPYLSLQCAATPSSGCVKQVPAPLCLNIMNDAGLW